MGEVIKFPITPKPISQETMGNSGDSQTTNVLDFKRTKETNKKTGIKACFLESSPKIVIGGGIIVKVCEIRYKGTVTDIIQKDENGNVTKVAYVIPSLNGDDPFKFGEADFIYRIETHD